MSTPVQQYVARIVALTEGKDPLTVQRETPRLLAKFIEGASDAELRRSPAPGKWSVDEIVAHLAECEIASSWRYRQILEKPGAPLSGFDQEAWARIGNYAEWNLQESLQMFRLLREANLRMVGRLSPDDWHRHGMHSERGRLTLQELFRQMAGHDLNHLEQVKKILGRQ